MTVSIMADKPHGRRSVSWLSGIALGLGLLFGSPAVDAAIVDVFRYELGEAGTMVGNLPQDSVGTGDSTGFFGAPAIITTGLGAPGSSAAASYLGGDGSFSGNSSAIPTDNFGVEFWVRTSNVNLGINQIISMLGNATGSLQFQAGGGVWGATIGGTAVGSTAVATDDTWANLAVIRDSGVSTFYVDGVAQGAAITDAPVFGNTNFGIHVGVTPGGGASFLGDLDELRAFTFDPLTDDPVAALSSNAAVPEPSSMALIGLVGGVLAWRRRRSRR